MTDCLPSLSVAFVVPCYNEEVLVPELYRRLRAVGDTLGTEVQFVLVNDGSTDSTPALLNELAARDPAVKVLHLARNMGHQVALTAGLDFADADLVITLDGDLQDPPELAGELLAKLCEGFDVVHARRRTRAGEGLFKRGTAWLFYRLLGAISAGRIVPDTGDFRALSRPAVEAARRFREPHRFLRGLFAQLGFRQGTVYYDRQPRHAGETKYPLTRMVRLALDAVFNHSAAPLRFITAASLLAWGLSLIYLIDSLYQYFVLKVTVRGWTSLVLLFSTYAGLQLTALTALGSYVGRIFEQGQRRPMYWLADARNLETSPAGDTPVVPAERDLSLRLVALRQRLANRNGKTEAP